MRLPGTFNQKRGAWLPDRARRPEPATGRPGGDPGRAARPRAAPTGAEGNGQRHGGYPDDELQLIAPPAYFLALCGRAGADGAAWCAARCPATTMPPPAGCTNEAEPGWWCFGCSRGGRIYDLASLMAGGPWGWEPRGDAFHAARELAAAAPR
jgi:hypothetical protein